MTQAQRIKWNEDMMEQLHQLELKKKAMREEELNERLWVKYYSIFSIFILLILFIQMLLKDVGASCPGGTSRT